MIKTVTVIGGSGFLGRATVERLARLGMRVIVLCRNTAHAKFLKPMGDVGQITLVAGNASNEDVLDRAIAPADAVVNLVGILTEGGSQRFDSLQGALPGRIGAMAARHNLQVVVHVSAIGADAASPSVYARSKAAGESGLKKEFPMAVILRPSIIFGPRDDFFNRFAGMALLAPALPLPGGGKMLMQPVYVEDVAQAIIAGLGLSNAKLKTEPAGKIYEVGGPNVYSFRQLMEMTLDHIERKRALLSIPLALMSCGAAFAGLLPNPPVTLDQVRLLRLDNVVSPKALDLADLGIIATSAEVILPTYLDRYRPGGLFRGR